MNTTTAAAIVALATALVFAATACGDDSPGDNAATTTETDDTALSTEMTVEEAEEALVGLSEQDAADVADDRGWTIRVVVLDGENRPMTMDFRRNRVNVEVADGEVVAIVGTG